MNFKMKSTMRYWFSCVVLFLFADLIILQDAQAQRGIREIHQERSLYRNIIVTEDSSRRCLRFTITRRTGQNQSCRFLENPQALVFPYAKMTLSSLLVQDDPQRILIIGLGGGTLPEVYHTLFPEAEIIISEIDEAVLSVAEDFFDFAQTDKIKVDIGDGRVYVKRAALRNESFDLVIIDAFNGEYIPEHLMTEEFLQEIKQLLPEDGMLVSNTFSTSRLYDAESQTYQNVFGEIINLRMNNTGNRIIIASRQSLPDLNTLNRRAANWRSRLEIFDMDVTDYPRFMSTEVDWNTEERSLTDQYSPANLLNN
jgi:spermidine synthase